MVKDFKIRKSAYVILIFLTFFFVVSYINKGNVFVKIKIDKKELPTSLVLDISLTTNTNQVLLVPQKEKIVVGFKNDINADCFFEVFEINDSSEIEISPTSDYQYLPSKEKDKLIALKKNKPMKYCFDICNFYHLDSRMKYKIKLIFKMSNYNHVDDISSDWIIIN